MHRVLKIFAFFGVGAFALGSLVYLALHALMPRGYVFGALYRMFLYHENHPFQYIAVVAFIYAVIGTTCAIRWPGLQGWRRHAAVVVVLFLTVLVASIPGGILWKIHDMEAGFFPKGAQFWRDLMWGADAGLQFGWLIVVLSLPYNIICFILGFLLTSYGFKISTSQSNPTPEPAPPAP